MKLFIGLCFLLWSSFLLADDAVLNVYNWSNYIPNQVLRMFEKQTGIHVNYTTYEDNPTLYAKLKADPSIGYDVVFPSSYYVQRMAREGMLHRLDFSKLSNMKNLNHLLLDRRYDPKNHYSLPYLWGTSGIMVNSTYYDPKTIQTWSHFWQSRFKGQLLLLDDPRDVFSMALISLGDSINTNDPNKIQQAYLKLKVLLPNVKLFNNGGVIPIYADGDANIGMILSGDAFNVTQINPKLTFIYPQKGIILWIDCMTIPKYAPHMNNAYRFMNFLMRPDVAKMISVSLGYSTPNKAAVRLMPKFLRENRIINPPDSVIKHGQVEAELSYGATQQLMNDWQKLKLSA